MRARGTDDGLSTAGHRLREYAEIRRRRGRPRGPGRGRPGAPRSCGRWPSISSRPSSPSAWRCAELAVFVDARLAEEETDIAFSPVEPSSATGSGGHISDPRSLLAMAEWLYGHAPRAWLLTFPGADFSIGEDLSEMAARGIDRALDRIAILTPQVARISSFPVATPLRRFDFRTNAPIIQGSLPPHHVPTP